MATRATSWLARAGVIMALSIAAAVGASAAAFAAETTISVGSYEPNPAKRGDTIVIKFDVTSPAAGLVQISVSEGSSAVNCTRCSWSTADRTFATAGATKHFEARASVFGSPRPGDKVEFTIKAGTAAKKITVGLTGQVSNGSVGKIEGVVVDSFVGQGIKGAVVTLHDGNQRVFTATAGDGGAFSFDGRSLRIAPGLMSLTAKRDPFVQQSDVTFSLESGQARSDLRVSMLNPAVASATPSEAAPSASASEGPVAQAPKADQDSGDSGGIFWIMIPLGAALMAVGIGAIVLLVRRNREEDEEDRLEDEDEDGDGAPTRPLGRRGGHRPSSRRRPDRESGL